MADTGSNSSGFVFPPMASILSWRTLVLVFMLTNLKSLHFMWFARFLRTFTRRLTDTAPEKHISPRCIFLPAISATRCPALECDYNLHKSNSTYFTDMDMSRGNFSLLLFGRAFNPIPGPTHFTMILGGTTCTWRKEIKPYARYELWTRVLSWDEKWLYVVTHFVKPGVFHPTEFVLQPKKRCKTAMGHDKTEDDMLKSVYASSVARYVFKNNRRTIPPEEALRKCNLLPDGETSLADIESTRASSLAIGRLEAGWEAVHKCLQPTGPALGCPDGNKCFDSYATATSRSIKLTTLVEYIDETDRVSQDYEDPGQEETSLAEDLTFVPDTTELDQHASALAHISPTSHVSHSVASLPGNSPASTQMPRHLRYSSELVCSPDSPYSRPPMQFTIREAELVKNFTENMALWADATDINRHFELEVPRRSLYFPVLRYAVFAFSSRHLNRDKADTSTEALEYYNSCLSVLIEAVDKASGHIDEETLAAIAILRQYEEMDAEDMEMHLTGTSRIVNSMSEFDFNGGLGEAAAWLCLRQDIYVSLTRLRPLRSNLENYLQSDIFRRTDDAAYANKMVFLLARSLSSIYPSDPSISNENLESIRLEVDGWFDSKPAAFNPILESARNKDEGKLLPIIWVLSPFHSVGLQYYHIAKIVLAMSLPIATDSVFEQIRESKKVERTIRNHLLQIIALASSHAKAENALFTARHSLSVWGSVFTERLDQNMVLDFLRHIQEKTGWQTDSLSLSLQQQWTQDSNED
ncbi:uncharacterized protein FTJAE_11371 [Fusarium tjaetaba]|uniref:Uncharacterized protein n=1 Tax=Fusarium tjaetaba TaxID=1567544 RepID=A0A8H5QU20_9HYPO|nr:uncharacterized protein FTJAE_11371 [Fusarium tjaetaba]KAF5621342.1 hypothetical protein FTJAE_11371 [Fusarium tjaetaba]